MAKEWEKLRETYPDGIPGNDVPNLVEGQWLNSDATRLEDFRGRFVLLDFWFIGCGPCHREEPTLKLIHQTFPPDKFALVTVHNNSQTVDNVREFVNENRMRFPTVVDNAEGDISGQYRDYGIYFYPGYILIDPSGKIVRNDGVPDSTNTLRMRKIELIQAAIQDWDWSQTAPAR